MRKSSQIIEDLVLSMEEMIDAMDEAWEAGQQGKWRVRDNIQNNTLPRAKERFKGFLDEYIDRRIETFDKAEQ